MAKAFKLLLSAQSSIFSAQAPKICSVSRLQSSALNTSLTKYLGNCASHSPRAHCTLSAAISQNKQIKSQSLQASPIITQVSSYGTEVDNEISKFLEKEIEYEKSRSSGSLPPIPGFEISTKDADVTLNKTFGSEKITVRFTVNGAVDSVLPETQAGQPEEPPQMVCRPPFEVELNKGNGSVLALQCSFPALDEAMEETGQNDVQNEDQFEIQEVAIHDGEWKDSTYSVSAATMDAELFDLLMDMLDERGVNDEFIAHLVDYCTAYENQKYVSFLNNLKSYSEK